MATSGNTLWLVVTDCWILLPVNIAAAIVVMFVDVSCWYCSPLVVLLVSADTAGVFVLKILLVRSRKRH